MITFELVTPQILSVTAPQELLPLIFCRYQEHYESPKFRGKIFSMAEYKQWYVHTYGQWSYVKDWSAFNIPSEILRPFVNGDFAPLDDETEGRLLNPAISALHGTTSGYIIGTVNRTCADFKHELSHAFYRLDSAYKQRIDTVLSLHQVAVSKIKQTLKKMGYCNEVLDDEAHAYLLDNDNRKIIPTSYLDIAKKIQAVFNEKHGGIK